MLTLLTWCLAIVVMLPLAVLFAELAAGTIGPRATASTRPDVSTGSRAVILMPAHNEAAGIGRTIAQLAPQLGDSVRLVVVADNCSDDTAALARKAGATVIERHDSSARGKGHALAFGRDWLHAEPPDCVVVLDADCEIEGDGLARLVAHCVTSGRPVQSCYLLRTHADDGPMVQISNFAFLVKNRVRQRGWTRIGAPGMLGGTGMAFPWKLFETAPLATSNLVEDLVLGIDFAKAGHAPLYLEEATTWSDPASQQDTRTQRTRWEHGFLQTAFQHGLPLIGRGLASGRWGLIWLGLNLLVPPLALLMTVGGGALVATGGLALLGATPLPFALLLTLLVANTLLLGLAWGREGRDTVRAATLVRIPLYLLWKLPVYLKLARGAQSEWVRTKRIGE